MFNKLAYRVEEASEVTGIPRTKLYGYAAEGKLTFRKAGRLSLITADELRRLVESLPSATIGTKAA